MSFYRTTSILIFTASFAYLTSCGKDAGVPLAATTKAEQNEALAVFNRAATNEAAGKTKAAIKGYRLVVKDYPLSTSAAEASYREAALLEKQGNLLDAFDLYHSFLSKYPASTHYSAAIKRQEEIAHAVAKGHITNSFIGLKTRIEPKKATEMLAKVRDNAPRSPSASRAQFAIGQVWENRNQPDQAVAAYRRLSRDFPNAPEAPEAQYRIGFTLANKQKNGNPDTANLDRAKEAYEDLLLRYPNSKRASDARREVAKLSSGDIQRSYDLAEFYRKKGKNTSAVFYYGEVIRMSKTGALRSQAENWIKQLGQ